MRTPFLPLSWWKRTVLRLIALYSLTGTVTRPKLIAPVQIERGIVRSVTSSLRAQTASARAGPIGETDAMSTTPAPAEAPIQDRPAELLARLLRFDTTNPPGNERECIDWVRGLLEELGCEVRVLAAEPERPSLVARLEGEGSSPPLLLQGHVDVVAAPGDWRHPPFAGEQHDGFIWGRGALDMKGGVAMMLAAFMRAKAAGRRPPGDVILCLMADEEAGSALGAEFLVREHPELFDGVRYSIGEFGAFRMEVAGRAFYPVMVAEKQICWTRATMRGRAGHGSMPVKGGAMGSLGRLLERIDGGRLPVHVPAVTRMMVEAIASELPPAGGPAAPRPAATAHHRQGARRARRPRAHVRPAAAQHGSRDDRARRREDQRDPR